MDARYNEQRNNENQNRKTSGAANLFLTLLWKNRDTVEVALSDERVLTGYIAAFDDQGIIIGLNKTGQNQIGEVYATRQQIVTISPVKPLCYLYKEKE